jgi:dienelactone hydrolase
MKRFIVRLMGVLVVVLLLATAGFVVWGSTPAGPLPQAEQALVSDSQVKVTQEQWLVFDPAAGQPDTGLIFYPGGRVEYHSYALQARAIAAQGYRVVIVPMPLSLAVFGIDRASDVMAAYPEIKHWAVGGHSLGGAMAAQFIAQNPSAVQGLVLWAAYPADSSSLAGADLKVVSIYGTEDGLATGGKISASKALLPAGTQYVAIEGGNHAQFGAYGLQSGDGQATISAQQQQDETVLATVELLKEIKGQ